MYMIDKGAQLFARLIVAAGTNPNKRCSFAVEERLEMLRACTVQHPNVTVDHFEGRFLVAYAESVGAGYILRGIRSHQDYEFERAMRNINEDLSPDITTVFLVPPRDICEVSSNFVKGLIGPEGWKSVVKPYVPAPVYERLLASGDRFQHHDTGPEGSSM